MEANQQYLLDKHRKTDNKIETLREYAEQNAVPIVDRLSLEMIKQLIRIHRAKNILEIGTAIGYSSMQFASVSNDIHITTIERDEEMITQAKSNFETYGYSSQIRLIEGNALEQYNEVNDKQYDIIFIDAAKAQSKKFFEYYTPLLRNGGLVITDNVLYHGFVSNIDIVRSRNVKQMVKKVQKFNDWLISLENYSTNFINMDDGLAISIKGE
ncbi:O-methyltransferase [Staphylococcus sp. EG-SA-6]|jgi:predicted O-methyltransferase YrrM|uniref:tRNA 5-hydroxyuridine methyltransferase n=3 Tax=Staphylococcus haemolyticus TaxID=1283 RepID=A0A2A1K8K5_STAHA|nr:MULTISPECIES: O-methyltransferase [Staphylococcus]MBN4936055.1 O-methyltransferase [Staphylococcus sp. EG-SA-6]MDU5816577.1 O-methyltransferase [Staphylococcus sp.]AKC76050.1 caffeoyl-CoA O-methyltransferase [Staphylococcus haemolyticus]AMW23556.1 methyltransferase [Staphylococcus haemolyticus]AUV67329.1 O-methyltransferase [Staphylococcus haemolyticus]